MNPFACEKILEAVRTTIEGYPFSFASPDSQARIITGQEEGTFGWTTANYVSSKLGSVSYTLNVGEILVILIRCLICYILYILVVLKFGVV